MRRKLYANDKSISALSPEVRESIRNEIIKRTPIEEYDEVTFRRFINQLDDYCVKYVIHSPIYKNTPTEQRRELQDILKAFTKPKRRSPVDYLCKLADQNIKLRPSYSLPPAHEDELFDKWSNEINKAADKAGAALAHIENLIGMIEQELKRQKRGRGQRLSRTKSLDRAVEYAYLDTYGQRPPVKIMLTEIKLIVREALGEPCTDIRKSNQ